MDFTDRRIHTLGEEYIILENIFIPIGRLPRGKYAQRLFSHDLSWNELRFDS